MKKKLLSLFLAVSMVAAMVIVPTTASAANDPVSYKQLLYSQNFDDESNVKLNNTTAFTTLPGETWCGYDTTAVLEARSQETPNDMCLKSPNAGSKLFIWTLPSAISVTDNTTYELSFDYYASGAEIFYMATPGRADTYVRMQNADALSYNQWNTVTMIFNAANQTISVNGVGIASGASWNASESYTRFMVSHTGSIDVKIDNFKMYKYVYTPTVEGVSFIDNFGNEITDFEDMTPAVSAVKVNITNAASVDEILENFWIFNEKTEEEVELGEATYENNVFTIALPNGLQGGCDYSINVDAALANANGETGAGAYISFNTAEAELQAELKATSNGTYDSQTWKTLYKFDFSNPEQLNETSAKYDDNSYNSGTYKNGFIEKAGVTYDETKEALAADGIQRPFALASREFAYEGDVMAFKFKANLDAGSNYSISIGCLGDFLSTPILLRDFGGEAIKYGEWQQYTVEIHPAASNGHFAMCYRGDESNYKTAVRVAYTFPNPAYTYANWIRMETSGEASQGISYFDDLEFAKKRIIFANDFSNPSNYATDTSENYNNIAVFHSLNGDVGNDQRLTVDASNENSLALKLWLGATYDQKHPIKFSFDLNSEEGTDILFRMGAFTYDVSESFNLQSDTYVGGEAFVANKWQKYNFVIYPNNDTSQQYFKAWRGDISNIDDAITTSYTMATNRTIVSNLQLLNGAAADAGVTYQIDNMVVEMFYDDNFEVVNPEITGVEATIDNSASVSGNYWLIIAGYEGGAMDKIELKPLTLESTNKSLTDTLNVPEDMAGCENIKAFLWDSKTLEPLTGFIKVK